MTDFPIPIVESKFCPPGTAFILTPELGAAIKKVEDSRFEGGTFMAEVELEELLERTDPKKIAYIRNVAAETNHAPH